MSIGALFERVPYGTKRRFDCPSCGGNETLSISKEDGQVLYHCYKARCGISGSRMLLIRKDDIKDTLHSRTVLERQGAIESPFVVPDHWIMGIASKKCFQMLLNTNSIDSYTDNKFKVAYDPKLNRLVYLITDNTNKIVGAIGRSLTNQKPKVFNYNIESNTPFSCGKGSTAVLVEDCASACSIGRLNEYTGIALLGTNIKSGYLFHIVSNFNNIIIALDADATGKAIKLKQSIEYYANQVKIWKLKKDLKDMSKEEIQNYRAKQPIIITKQVL